MTLWHNIHLFFDTDIISKDIIGKYLEIIRDFNWPICKIGSFINKEWKSIKSHDRRNIIDTLGRYGGQFVSLEKVDGRTDSHKAIITYTSYIDHRIIYRKEPSENAFRYSTIYISFERFHAKDLGVPDYQNKLKNICNELNPIMGIFIIDGDYYEEELWDFLRGKANTFIPTGLAFYFEKKFYDKFGFEFNTWVNTHYQLEKTSKYTFGEWKTEES